MVQSVSRSAQTISDFSCSNLETVTQCTRIKQNTDFKDSFDDIVRTTERKVNFIDLNMKRILSLHTFKFT